METFTVYINSKDRKTGTFNDFKVNLNNVVRDIKKIEVKSVRIPNTYYIINSNNNTFTLTESGVGSYTVTLTEGNYTAASLYPHLQTQLIAAGSYTYVVAYSVITNKYTISNATGDFTISFADTAGGRSLAAMLGMTLTQTSTSNSLTTTNMVNLATPSHMFINLNNFYFNGYSTGNTTFDIVVPNQGDFYEVNLFQNQSNYMVSNSSRVSSLGYLQVSLFDEDRIFELHGDWQMVLCFYC